MSTLAQRVAFLEGVRCLFPGATDRSVTGYSLHSEWGFMRLPVNSEWVQWVYEWRNGRDNGFHEEVEARAALGWKISCIEWMDWPKRTKVVLSLDCRFYYTHRYEYNSDRGDIVSRTCLLRPLRRAQNRLAIRKAVTPLLAKLPSVLVAVIAEFACSHRIRLARLLAELKSTETPP